MSSSYRLELNNWLAQLEVEADCVVDIGGAQENVKGRTKSWKVNTYLIADLHHPHKDSPSPDYIIDLNDTGFKYWEQANLVFCLEVLDYVYDPVSAFKNIAMFMLKGGNAWISAPFAYPLHNPAADDSLRYTSAALEKLAQRVGLSVEEMIPRYAETSMLTAAYSAERMRAAKHMNHDITGWIMRASK